MGSFVLGAVAAATVIVGAGGDAYAQAEHYQPFRFDSGLSGTYVSASGRGGFGAVVEPKFYVHDNIAVGGRLEGAVMFGGSIDQMTGDTQMDMGAVGAVMAKGEYLHGLSAIRPFAGLGIGLFDIASQSLAAGPTTTGIDQKAGRYFGVAPQVGIDLGRLRLAATYNMILGADIEVRQTIGGVEQTASFSQNYMTFELSIRFGGGKKRAPMIVMAPPPPGYGPPPPAPSTPASTPASAPAPAPAPGQMPPGVAPAPMPPPPPGN
jgi:outer membrane protein X